MKGKYNKLQFFLIFYKLERIGVYNKQRLILSSPLLKMDGENH